MVRGDASGRQIDLGARDGRRRELREVARRVVLERVHLLPVQIFSFGRWHVPK